MRRWLIDLHLYLGLLCLPYLVVFGVSSIALNHDLGRATRSEWSARVAPAHADQDASAARAALAELGLSAGVLEHTLEREASGALRFEALRLGRSYQVAIDAAGAARVRELNGGVVGIVRGLHGRHDTSSAWGFSWALYTELATAVLLFSIVSGIVLVWPRAGERALGYGACALGLIATAALAAAIW